MGKKNKGKMGLFEDRASIFDSPSTKSFMIVPSLDFSSLTNPLATGSCEADVNLIRESSSLLSSKLTQLVFICEMYSLREQSPELILKAFREIADQWGKEGKISKAERNVLYKASEKDPGSIQILINACPYVICLPFIREYLIDLLIRYKLAPKGTLKPIKQQWQQLLPTRAKNKLPYAEADIKSLLKNEIMFNKKNPSARIAAALGISPQKVRQVYSIKSGPGRFKKACK